MSDRATYTLAAAILLAAVLVANAIRSQPASSTLEPVVAAPAAPPLTPPDHPTVSLLDAAKAGNVEQMQRHLYWCRKEGCDVDARDAEGECALFWAARLGHAEVAKLLLELGADPNRRNAEFEAPALIPASGKGHPSVVRVLLDAGADVNATTRDGSTALHSAAFYGYPVIARMLLDAGANVNATSHDGGTPLSSASYADVASVLLDAGASVNSRDRKGKTALHRARQFKKTDVEALLRSRGGTE